MGSARNGGASGPHSAAGWGPAGEESCGWPLRENDRGAAGFRSDMPHRAAEGLACCKGRKERACHVSVFGTDGIAGAKNLTLTAVRMRRCL
ncbi:MAG: hypothetical protein EOS64_28680 [Mesorhizobium sp.]|nr:MAG: hypothetical protein EOS64_28680 [Mesorhizobium sp.]